MLKGNMNLFHLKKYGFAAKCTTLLYLIQNLWNILIFTAGDILQVNLIYQIKGIRS